MEEEEHIGLPPKECYKKCIEYNGCYETPGLPGNFARESEKACIKACRDYSSWQECPFI